MNLFGSNMLPMISKNAGGSLLLDAITANTAYSVRKLRTAYGGPCVRLRRSSDNAESDFGFSGNDLDVASIASWLGANTGFLVTWYDQTGNVNNASQATTTKQPVYFASGIGGKPAFKWDGVDDAVSAGATPARNDAFTVAAVASTILSTANAMIACYGDGSLEGWNLGWDSANAYKAYLILKTTTGAWGDHFAEFGTGPSSGQGYRILGWRSGGTSAIRVNGSEVQDAGQATAMQYGTVPVFVIGNRKSAGNECEDQYIPEIIYMGGAASAGEMSSIDSSQSAYFGV